MEKIRVLHVVSSLSTGSGIMGVIMNYYRHIDHEKVQFDFLYFIENEITYKNEINKLGGKFYFLARPSVKNYIKYKNFFKENENKYKAVHLHEVYLNLFVLPIAKKYGIKYLITHSHNTKFSDKKLSAIRNRMLCIPIKKQANMYFACSKAAGATLYGQKYVDSGKVIIINNAIDIDRFRFRPDVRTNMRRELQINDMFVVGHIGRFAEQKNHSFLLEIFFEIRKRKANSILMLVGDGPLFEDIKNKAKKLGIKDSVMFLGRKSNVEDYLQAMDVFVLPSLFEGSPVAGVEAQASGLPCFFSNSITNEIDIINSTFASISIEAKKWAELILEYTTNFTRTDTYDYIESANFNIKKEADKLFNYYNS